MNRRLKTRTVLMSAVALTAWPSLAAAGPPGGAQSGDFQAPYRSAWFGSTSTCLDDEDGVVDVTCTVTGSADATSGHGETASTYSRTSPEHKGLEEAFGFSVQQITYKVPRDARTVTATFSWQVSQAQATAESTSGSIVGYAGVAAIAPACGDDAGCTGGRGFQTVLFRQSVDGMPSAGNGSGSAQKVTLTVSAKGTFPRNLTWHAYPYSIAAGDASRVCPTPDRCQAISPAHAGRAHASISATLLGVQVSASR